MKSFICGARNALAGLTLWALGHMTAGAADLYRTNATGTWADSHWVDASLAVFSEPTLSDHAIVGFTGFPGVVSASVTVSAAGGAVSNLSLGYYTGTANVNPRGTLVLAADATLRVTNTFWLGRGGKSSTYKGAGEVAFGENAHLWAGRLVVNASTLTYTGGALTVSGDVVLAESYVNSQNAYLIQDGGSQTFGGSLYAGTLYGASTDRGYIRLTNNAALTVAKTVYVGAGSGRGKGDLAISPGSSLNASDLHIQSLANPFVRVQGDQVAISNLLLVGTYQTALTTFIQDGGTLRAGSFNVGNGDRDAADRGIYWLTNNATLLLTRPASGTVLNYIQSSPCRNPCNGTVFLGDPVYPGTIAMTGAGTGLHSLVVKTFLGTAGNAATGFLIGWGGVHLNGELRNNGLIFADGYGSDRDLVLTNFSSIGNTVENTATNGWYARHGGRLALPVLAVPAGTSATNWGEAANDTAIDLVNSARLAFSGVTGGPLSVSLLAADRADAKVSAETAIGVWSFDPAGGFAFGAGDATLTFRYDSARAAQKGLTEDDLKIWRYANNRWTDVTASVDTANKRITSTAVTAFSLFAVSTETPAPYVPAGTVIVVF